ncbi:dihydroneopterin triphosphate diphosphatase [Bowmanella yangjiangensis]|uniref:Dihydroneopterin triphosphate diphosphatase n=1 Tax=Bowmanella yangjiangensis TaxID=2811230 RepID=A0ABS3CTV6_9ALTE|nr:dihydroneopterin triphosphate diphosphatase [Bowmanella yangjiangensis]MBN7819084.1 dihydroneopterin triphosphate diphosphatase [Bowmanella yangjiangensis]
MSFKQPRSVLVVIYDQHHRVLVMQRLDDANFWQSVTGSMEPDEQPFQTALREVLEETGIDVAGLGYQLVDCAITNEYEIRPAWRHRYAPGVTTNTEYVFSLKVKPNQAIELSEHSDFLWLPWQDAVDKVWSQTNRKAIQQLACTWEQDQ